VWFLRSNIKILKMQRLIFAGTVILISLFALSCKKIEKISARPNITYTSFQIFDTTDILGNESKGGRLKFYFEDGDGDIGLDPPTLPGQDSVNMFFKLYRITGGDTIPAADNDLLKPSDYRIPYLPRVGQNNVLRGTISVTFLYLFYSPSDTIQYEFYIKDRASHVSNVLSTCGIVLGKDSLYMCN
jgi:hypothetical protein